MLIPLEVMRSRVVDSISTLGSTVVELHAALGSVLATDVVAQYDYPLFDNSAMDGFAVRSADVGSVPVGLSVIGVSAAGHPFDGVVAEGQAARILTGAPMVPGADCVVPVEATTFDQRTGVVVINEVPESGAHVRPRGDVVRVGDVVLLKGTVLNPGHLGFLASLGIATVEVVSRPTVVILSTGDELVAPGTDPGPGQIFESNTVLLTSLLNGMGCQVEAVDVRDDVDAIGATLERLSRQVDVIISTGGVSMGGEYDALRNAAVSFDVEVVQVAIKPAKPFAFGRVGDSVMFGLPGNPGSVVVSFESFVRPALRRMAGLDPAVPPTFRGVLGAQLSRPFDDKVHFFPMRMTGEGMWVRSGVYGSHAVSPFADASAMVALEAEQTDLDAGTEVDLIPLWT